MTGSIVGLLMKLGHKIYHSISQNIPQYILVRCTKISYLVVSNLGQKGSPLIFGHPYFSP